MKKEWEFALPDPEKNKYEKERFTAMSDTLYTYLYSISKHNPARYPDGILIEPWNYLYIDKDKDNKYPRYNASQTQRILGISKSTYYRRLQTLIKYDLIKEEKDSNGRRYYKIPFIQSKMILPVKTCAFFTNCQHRKNNADDIIKLMAILKIYYYSENKYFTKRQLRLQMGYSATHTDKDEYINELLITLRGFGIIDWIFEEKNLPNNKKEIRYIIKFFDDKYNDIMEGFSKDAEFTDVSSITEEEKRTLFPIE